VSTDLFDIFSQALKAAGYATELERLTALVPEASARRYFRLHLSDGQTIVGVSEEPASAAVNMPNVLAVQKFLTAGNVAVPQIFYTEHRSRHYAAARPRRHEPQPTAEK
jgi:aminoglycoside/choline kinase family phosphotransferase